MSTSAEQLRSIKTFEQLVAYLETELDWPLREYGFEDLTFEYQPAELGLKDEDAAKVRAIHQLRPLQHGQPWGIFFVEFEKRKLPVVVLRRILSHLVIKKRASANKAKAAAWDSADLLFISAFGEEASDQREIAFAHFHQESGDLPTLRVLGWDGGDTPLKLEHVAATLGERLRWPDDPANHAAWREQWSRAFRHRIGHVIRTADALAEVLAQLARSIRDSARTLMRHESEKGQLRRLHNAFQTALIHDLDEESFADTYAQTITYGLLTAAISRTEMTGGSQGTNLIADNVADIVPVTNPFLKEMLQSFLAVGGRKGGIDFDELGIQDVVELLRGGETDLPAILRDFGNRTRGEDPVIHFYEHFLSAYNKKLKIQRGVFYTPQPVVSYIVRSVNELLQTEFGLEDGLASTVTWGEMAERTPGLKLPKITVPKEGEEGVDVERQIDPTTPFVQILDPATGTATFLVEVIDVIHKHLKAKWDKGGLAAMPKLSASSSFIPPPSSFPAYWNQYVPLALLARLHGYELMMAPYAIAHMKIGLKLHETGYRFGSDERARVYLTNALEPPQDFSDRLAFDAPALAHEAQAVNTIKRRQRFTVVIGNPPYAKSSSNRQAAAEALVEPFKAAVRSERNIQPLSDDYVKFLGFVRASAEVVPLLAFGMITNRGYLNGLIHRGARQVILEKFGQLWAVDLHGDSNVGETAIDGRANENVFDIQQGVAILLGLKSSSGRSNQSRFDSWGSRDEKHGHLAGLRFGSSQWTKCAPRGPNYFFQQETNSATSEEGLIPLGDSMPTTNTGIKTHRDELVVEFECQALLDRIRKFVDPKKSDDQVRASFFGADTGGRYKPGDNRDWSMAKARKMLQREEKPLKDFVREIDYRPFDRRFIFYHSSALDFGREDLMAHMEGGRNLGLVTTRQVPNGDFCHALVTRRFIEMKTGSHDRGTNLFPLYLKSDPREMKLSGVIRPNFSEGFLKTLSSALDRRQSGSSGLPEGIAPEDIFHYTYAVLHSPGYRSRYAEFLKIDFPRLPVTASLELFRALALLGGELVAFHLLEFKVEAASSRLSSADQRQDAAATFKLITRFVGDARTEIEKVSYEGETVWIDKTRTAGFSGVPPNVWDFHIGGYQVCQKWLKDRKGRTLSPDDIAHYQKVVVALHETIRLMKEIDEVIAEHGGWPAAFQSKS